MAQAAGYVGRQFTGCIGLFYHPSSILNTEVLIDTVLYVCLMIRHFVLYSVCFVWQPGILGHG